MARRPSAVFAVPNRHSARIVTSIEEILREVLATPSVMSLYEHGPAVPDYVDGDKPNAPWSNFVICLDVSGSTNNMYSGRGGGRSRRGSGYCLGPDNEPVSKTPPIIVAEMKGIAITLALLANSFNVEANCDLICFSTELTHSNVRFDTSAAMHEYARNFQHHVTTEFGSTATKPALEYAFADKRVQDTLLIIATDGQPTTGGTEKDILDFMDAIKRQFVVAEARLDLVVIGAGSIMETHGETSTMCTRTVGRSVRGNTYASGAECNLAFLHDLKQASTDVGVYLPACGEYEILIETMKRMIAEVVTGVQNIRWIVQLDGSCSYLPDSVNQKLAKIKTSDGLLLVDLVSTFGSYLFDVHDRTLSFQVKLTRASEEVATEPTNVALRSLVCEHQCEVVTEIHPTYHQAIRMEMFDGSSIEDKFAFFSYPVSTLARVGDTFVKRNYGFDLTSQGQLRIRKIFLEVATQ